MTTQEKADNHVLDLKARREALGLTLKDLFQRTRISVINLEAIERGDFQHLPVPIYTKNFIKTYANALGIDNKPILEQYETYLSSLNITATAPVDDPTQKVSFSTRIAPYKTYLWVASFVIFFVAAALFISMQHKPSVDLISKPPVNSVSVAPAPMQQEAGQTVAATNLQKNTAPMPAMKDSGKPLQPALPATVPLQKSLAAKPAVDQQAVIQNEDDEDQNEETGTLIIKATEETWIRIKTDRNPSVQVLLKSGEKIERKAARLEMDIGNAGGIKIQFKGRNIENLGKSGEVIHLRLP